MSETRETIVISAVNLRKGGTLTILRQCLEYLSGISEEYHVVALVHDRALCDFPGITYLEMPWCTVGWLHRLWTEYVTMHRISRRMESENGRRVFLWLSLHDSTPNVRAEHQAVYCHTSFPFMKVHARDFLMDPKIPLFSILTGSVYKFNVTRNDWLIVQQDWFRGKLAALTGFPEGRIIVAPPHFESPAIRNSCPSGMAEFLYPSTPDCHKNFETLCRAAEILESRVGKGTFRVTLTISGKENRYSRWLFRRWGKVSSLDFSGFLPREELYDRYSKAGCLVFPSRIESWGLPVSEFLPGGKPVILSDLPYAHETAGSACNAAFFDPDDPESLAELMSGFMSGDMSGFVSVPEMSVQPPFAEDWKTLFDKLLTKK